ncbi:aquaporin [Clostridia bacterium]|nr:aquaporin [Clostridia bacterium]
MKKLIAELIGTFILVFISTGTAVFGNGMTGVGIAGIALAFGCSIVAVAYSIGTISGAHVNPAVSLAMFINKRISVYELIYYIIGQIIGAILGSAAVHFILRASSMTTENMGQNLTNSLSIPGAFVVEILLTFIFVLVILAVTSHKRGNPPLAGIVIGLTLTLVHLIGIPLTGTSVNPARSIGPALFAGGTALSELWIFILAPLIGGIIAAFVSQYLFETEDV